MPHEWEFFVDRERRNRDGQTGIFVRAKDKETGQFGSFDIACLDEASLLKFLQSRGGNNQLAEDTVGIILGHGHLHRPEQRIAERLHQLVLEMRSEADKPITDARGTMIRWSNEIAKMAREIAKMRDVCGEPHT